MTKKSAVIFFHKNILKLYKKHWIDKCVNSILNQSHQDFDIFEINYGNEDFSVLENKYSENHKHFFYKENFPTHVEAMVFLLNKCFVEMDYEYVFNTNLDDYYHPQRIEKQIECCNKGYVFNSTLWNYFKEEVDFEEEQGLQFSFERLHLEGNKYATLESVRKRLVENNHNVINHSGVCFTRKFWEGFDENGNKLRYRNDKPYEDLTFWTRAIKNDYLLTVINENLINYRLHENQIGNQNNNNESADKGFTQPDYTPIRYGIITIVDKQKVNLINNFLNYYHYDFFVNKKKTLFVITDDKNYIKNYFKNEKNIYFEEVENVEYSLKENYIKKFGVKAEILCDQIYYLDISISSAILEKKIDLYKEDLEISFQRYYSDEKMIEAFGRLPKSRYYTFNKCMDLIQENNYNTIVELGTSRSFVDGAFEGCNCDDIKYWEPYNQSKWDWSAGFFTYVFGEFINGTKKILHTVDIISSHIERCKIITNQFKKNINYHVSSSNEFLKNFDKQIDFLYIDTGEFYPLESFAQYRLEEVKIIVERDLIRKGGIILIDDVRNLASKEQGEKSDLGKSKYAISYLIINGFEVIMDEYQVILIKK